MWVIDFLIFGVLCGHVRCQYLREMRDSQPRVNLQQGMAVGEKIRLDSGRAVNSFLGIPYATPPLGNLRFLPPQKHPGWNGTYQATDYKPRCPQLPIEDTQNEDCLFLNVWIPEISQRTGLLPVILFFDGHDFSRSTPTPVSGQDLASQGVIVVSANYRLNIFGFLCLGSESARGNLGLLDQYFSLLWIRENARHFGGDPQKITLFGHGSGAASVVLHMVSPRTAGLFQRAIVSSGSAVAPWLIDNSPVKATQEIIRILGCNLYQIDSLQCLRSKPAESLLRAYEEYTESGLAKHMFYPVVDTFLPEHNQYLPIEVGQTLRDGTYYQVPILTGISKPVSNNEQVFWSELAGKGYMSLERYVEKSKIPEVMKMYRFDNGNKDEIFDLIRWKYVSPSMGNPRALFDDLKQLDFETKIEAPHFLQLNYLLGSYIQSIYVYYIDYDGFALNTTDFYTTSDMLLLFGPSLLRQIGRRSFTPGEMRLSQMMKQFWLDFVNVGIPSPQGKVRIWRKYTLNDNYVEHIGANTDPKETYERSKRLAFWTQLLPKISARKSVVSNTIPRELQNSPDPSSGYRHGLYTLIALVIALLALLLICIALLKRRAKEKERELHMGF